MAVRTADAELKPSSDCVMGFGDLAPVILLQIPSRLANMSSFTARSSR